MSQRVFGRNSIDLIFNAHLEQFLIGKESVMERSELNIFQISVFINIVMKTKRSTKIRAFYVKFSS